MNDPATIGSLTDVVGTLLKSAIFLAGAGVIVMLIVGGFQYLTAGGDKESTQRAGKTITFAIIGLVVVLCAWLIILLVGTFLGFDSSSNIYNFSVCLPGFSGPNCTH